MRIRTMLGRLFVTAAMTVAAGGTAVAPAAAGTPYSPWCSDNVGWQEVHILETPITLNAEINRTPTDTTQQLQLCYSTTAEGVPGGVGGNVLIRYDRWSTPTPGIRLTVQCNPDSPAVVGPVTCFEQYTVQTLPSGLPTYNAGVSTFCLVPFGTGCLVFAPGAWVQLQPVLVITDTGGPLPPVEAPPALCVSLFISCP